MFSAAVSCACKRARSETRHEPCPSSPCPDDSSGLRQSMARRTLFWSPRTAKPWTASGMMLTSALNDLPPRASLAFFACGVRHSQVAAAHLVDAHHRVGIANVNLRRDGDVGDLVVSRKAGVIRDDGVDRLVALTEQDGVSAAPAPVSETTDTLMTRQQKPTAPIWWREQSGETTSAPCQSPSRHERARAHSGPAAG